MTKKTRIKALEKMKDAPWIDEPILICVRDCRRSTKPIAVVSFNLTVGSTQKSINRLPKESEGEFLDRVQEIGVKHLIEPKNRYDVPPGVILFQNTDAPSEAYETANERRQVKSFIVKPPGSHPPQLRNAKIRLNGS